MTTAPTTKTHDSSSLWFKKQHPQANFSYFIQFESIHINKLANSASQSAPCTDNSRVVVHVRKRGKVYLTVRRNEASEASLAHPPPPWSCSGINRRLVILKS
ncbi:hypothetical protein RchiOBHm_Chr5g0007391 [Rosa chinensis]|uniref:Uncharacterized protein n=1 Tax=Rosa chinensis TaxID=74649 RepID=A0A2P6Q3W4_ROSCH|nr:hypothetical protein RchiOBHm_Chr5g0007391 [Rosa chinensis]